MPERAAAVGTLVGKVDRESYFGRIPTVQPSKVTKAVPVRSCDKSAATLIIKHDDEVVGRAGFAWSTYSGVYDM